MRMADLMVLRRVWFRFSSLIMSASASPSWLDLRGNDGVDVLALLEGAVVVIVGGGGGGGVADCVGSGVSGGLVRFVVELSADVSPEGGLVDGAVDGGAEGTEGIMEAASAWRPTLSSDGGGGGRGRLILAARVRRRLSVLSPPTAPPPAPDESRVAAAEVPGLGDPSSSASSAIQSSHSSQPKKVPKLLQLTTETGDRWFWKMPAKQAMKMMTEQTCCRMTVESATRGQKS
jgi:hypothetical protein